MRWTFCGGRLLVTLSLYLFPVYHIYILRPEWILTIMLLKTCSCNLRDIARKTYQRHYHFLCAWNARRSELVFEIEIGWTWLSERFSAIYKLTDIEIEIHTSHRSSTSWCLSHGSLKHLCVPDIILCMVACERVSLTQTLCKHIIMSVTHAYVSVC